MLKFYSTSVVFAEVPDEISMCIELSNCPHRCKECHSPWLREDIGEDLTTSRLLNLIKENPDITCVCFMGGDSDHGYIKYLAGVIHLNTNLKVAMYSGDDKVDKSLLPALDYYKIGSYQPEFGPLNKETTNQRMYKLENNQAEDITYRFWKK